MTSDTVRRNDIPIILTRTPVAGRYAILFLLTAMSLVLPTRADDAAPAPKTSLRPGKPLTASELAQLLDAQIWKLDVTVPEGSTHVEVGLALKEKGHDGRSFGTSVSPPTTQNANHDVMIAIIPIGGTLHDAEKVRVVISVFGFAGAGTEDNPFRKLGVGRSEFPEESKDSSFDLIGGYEGGHISGPVSLADNVISLKIETSQK